MTLSQFIDQLHDLEADHGDDEVYVDLSGHLEIVLGTVAETSQSAGDYVAVEI